MKALLLVGALSTIAHAEAHRAPPVLVQPIVATEGDPPRTLVLNRCIGGCKVATGPNDAANNMSNIPKGAGDHTLTAFSFGDSEWAAVVQCVREVYSPYNITVTELRPSDPSIAWNEVMIAGLPTQVGLTSDILGIAPLAQDCRVLANSIAFVFANNHPNTDRILNICWTAAQESAHIYGLDHEFEFIDGTSACTDPMTYRTDCGGEKFFRDREAECGEDSVRACNCKGTQNSHRLLLDRFGAGVPITAPPVVAITSPSEGPPFTTGETVSAMASAQRGVDRVTLVLNGYPWTSVPGAKFLSEGQPNATYALVTPADVPDGNIDVQVSAADDLGIATLSDALHVTKGAPCVDASTCLTGQKCDAGKCYWDPPELALGAACDYPQACKSGVCTDGRCVQPCDPDSAQPQCPDSDVCDATSRTCLSSGGGCCSTAGPGGGWAHASLAAIVAAVAFRRRRRP